MKLPVVSGAEDIKAFEKIGYVVERQRGSHILLRRPGPPNRRRCVPNHKELAKGTLRILIKEAGPEVEDFLSLL